MDPDLTGILTSLFDKGVRRYDFPYTERHMYREIPTASSGMALHISRPLWEIQAFGVQSFRVARSRGHLILSPTG